MTSSKEFSTWLNRPGILWTWLLSQLHHSWTIPGIFGLQYHMHRMRGWIRHFSQGSRAYMDAFSSFAFPCPILCLFFLPIKPVSSLPVSQVILASYSYHVIVLLPLPEYVPFPSYLPRLDSSSKYFNWLVEIHSGLDCGKMGSWCGARGK